MSIDGFTIYDEIRVERERQAEVHGGAEVDDQNGPHDWVAVLCKYVGLASIRRGYAFNATAFRKSMISVAALAVAAAEWCDRQQAHG